MDLRRKQAEREIAAVNDALRAGYPPPDGSNSPNPTANSVAAKALGITQTHVLTRRVGAPTQAGTWARDYSLAPDWALYQPPEQAAPSITKLGGSDADREKLADKDEIRRLQSELKKAHRAALDDDAMRALLGAVVDAPAQPPAWVARPAPKRKTTPTQEVPVAVFADWHLGETVDATEVNGFNAFSLEIADQRVSRLVEGLLKLCVRHHTGNYPGMVVNLAGDFVSGGLHPELAKTDECESIPAALRARDLLVAALTRLADHFGRLYVPAVCGNHGRNTVKPEFKRYVYKNFDWLIYQLLVRHFADDPRIQIDVRPSNDVHYRVFNMRYMLVHGDMLGVRGGDGIIGAIGPIMRGQVKKSGQAAALGLDFDKIIMGHWHQDLWLPHATVANTLKGFDEYARLQLGAKPSRPSQPLWFVHPTHGETSHWNIYVDEPGKPATEWVAWRNSNEAAA